MKKKFLCYLLSVLMVVGLCSAFAFAENDSPTIAAGSAEVGYGTTSVEIPITVSNTTFASFGLKVSATGLTATSVAFGDTVTSLSPCSNIDNGVAYLTGAAMTNAGTSGTLATVTFSVPENGAGSYIVTVEEGALYGDGCFDTVDGTTYTAIHPTYTSGTVTVSAANPSVTINGSNVYWADMTGKTTATEDWTFIKGSGASATGKVFSGDTIVPITSVLSSTPACCVQVTSDTNATITAADGKEADWSDTALYVNSNGNISIAVNGGKGKQNIDGITSLTSYAVHHLTAHEAVAKTCTTAGNSAYWSCDQCGKYFSDETGTIPAEENSWVIPAGHTLDADGKCTVCQTRRYEPNVTETTAAAAVPETITVTENEAITMDVSSTQEDITKNEVAIPAAAMDALMAANSVTMTTNVGTLTFDKAALGRIDTAAGEDNVTISLESVSKPDGLPASEGEEVKYIELNAMAGGNPVFAGDGTGTATVSFDYPEPATGKNVKVYFIDNTSRTAVTASYANGKVSFTIGHFSTYEIVTESGYVVTVEDKTNNVATVTPSGDVVTVTCTKPCVAVYTTDGGTTYNRMTAVAAGTENTYTFTATADCTVVVALKGDVNLDGSVNVLDSSYIKRSLLSSGTMKITLETLNEKLADVDNTGSKNVVDSAAVKRSLLSSSHEMYQALTW